MIIKKLTMNWKPDLHANIVGKRYTSSIQPRCLRRCRSDTTQILTFLYIFQLSHKSMIELTVLLKKYLLQYNSLNITDDENTWKINKMISTLQQANLLIIYLHNDGVFFLPLHIKSKVNKTLFTYKVLFKWFYWTKAALNVCFFSFRVLETVCFLWSTKRKFENSISTRRNFWKRSTMHKTSRVKSGTPFTYISEWVELTKLQKKKEKESNINSCHCQGR